MLKSKKQWVLLMIAAILAFSLPLQTVTAEVPTTSTEVEVEALSELEIDSYDISKDLKIVTANFNHPVAFKTSLADLKSKTKLITGNSDNPAENSLGLNDKVVIADRKIVVTLVAPLSKTLDVVRLKFLADALKIVGGNSITTVLYNADEEAVPDKQGPRIARLFKNQIEHYDFDFKVSPDNKVITVGFDEPIQNASSLTTAQAKADALKNAVTMVNDNLSPTINVNAVTISGNKLTISLSAPINNNNYTDLKIAENAIQDALGNKNSEIQFGTGGYQDMTPPYVSSIKLLPDMKTMLIKYTEPIFPRTNLANVKAGIQISSMMHVRNRLRAADAVSLKGDTITVKFSRPFPKTGFSYGFGMSLTPMVVDRAGNYTDTGGGVNSIGTPNLIDGNHTALSPDKKTVTLTFDRGITESDPGTIKADISKKGGSEQEFSALATNDKVTIKNNQLIISLATALTEATEFRIEGGALEDLYGAIQSGYIISSPAIPDTAAPTISEINLSKNRKVIELTFSENIVNASTQIGLAAQLADLTAKLKTVVLNENDELVDAALAAGDSVKPLGLNKLQITFANALTAPTRIRILGSALKDATGNTMQLTTSDPVEPNTTKPGIGEVEVTNSNRTVALMFHEDIFFATGITAKNIASKVKMDGAALPAGTKVSIEKDKLVLVFTTPLTVKANEGKYTFLVESGTLRDENDNLNL